MMSSGQLEIPGFSKGGETCRGRMLQLADGAASPLCDLLFAAGWELGSPGRPGVRVHFPGTRQERLVDPEDVHVQPPGDV